MSFHWLNRLSLVIAAAVGPATLLNAQLPAPGEAPASLVGQLLIATPAMSDPRFDRTVILMVRHDRNGAFGIVINRPVGELPTASLLEALGDKGVAPEGTLRMHYGGPVQPDLALVIHSADYRRPESLAINGFLAMTASREILRDIAAGQGPMKSLVALGYAGWGPGQLEGELAQRTWFTAPADATLVFDQDRDKVWDDATANRTQDL